jgi:hypothetical protein
MNKAAGLGKAEITPQILMTEADAIEEEEERLAQMEFE